ncbi:hypothetical protein WDU94_010836 [Cyamophila willieti]
MKNETRHGPRTPNLVPATRTHLNEIPTPQRDYRICDDSIFGDGIIIHEVSPHESFNANYAPLAHLTEEIYDQMIVDEPDIGRLFTVEELSYYTTSMLWLRLISLKEKMNRSALTQHEKAVLKQISDRVFSLPGIISTYLQQIENITDSMGKVIEHRIPTLPVIANGPYTGYHAQMCTVDMFNIFSEIPTLGTAGIVMSLTSPLVAPEIVHHVFPIPGYLFNRNLAGNIFEIGTRSEDILTRLAEFGITPTHFPETVPNTRFNIDYIDRLSQMIGSLESFRIEKLVFNKLTTEGSDAQIVICEPRPTEDADNNWLSCTVESSTAHQPATATIGASYAFGFNVRKANRENVGNDVANIAANYCPVSRIDDPQVPNGIPLPVQVIDDRDSRLQLSLVYETRRAYRAKRDSLIADGVLNQPKPRSRSQSQPESPGSISSSQPKVLQAEEILLQQDTDNVNTDDQLLAAIRWLETNFAPWGDVREKWAQTSSFRLKRIQEGAVKYNDIRQYFDKFRPLQEPHGHMLLLNDFHSMYPGSETMLFDGLLRTKELIIEKAKLFVGNRKTSDPNYYELRSFWIATSCQPQTNGRYLFCYYLE